MKEGIKKRGQEEKMGKGKRRKLQEEEAMRE